MVDDVHFRILGSKQHFRIRNTNVQYVPVHVPVVLKYINFLSLYLTDTPTDFYSFVILVGLP